MFPISPNRARPLALLGAAGILLAACSGQPAAPTAAPAKPTEAAKPAATAVPVAKAGGTLIYGVYTKLDILDPTVTTFSAVGTIAYHLCDPIVWQTAPGKFEPGLAESWTISADGKEYTFKLRSDVKFQDGTPFNAEALKFNFDRIINPDTKSQTAFSLIGPYESSELVDANTLKVKFKRPYAPFLNSLSLPYLSPQSPTAVKAAGKDYGIKTVVCTGPFKWSDYKVDTELKLVKNPDYKWGPKHLMKDGGIALDGITFRIIPEDAVRSATLQSGELQFADSLPAVEFKQLSANKEIQIISAVQAGSGWSVMMNVEKEPTNDVKVRQALEWATDKQGLIDTVYGGAYKVGCSPLTPNLLGFDKATCDKYKFDLAKAGTILDDAGWKLNASTGIREKGGQPLKLDFHFRSDSGTSKAMATFLQANWKKAGVDLQLFGAERAGYLDAVRAGKHNNQFWWETGTDPDVVRILFHSQNAAGGTNRNRYKNADTDKLIDAAAAESDGAKRSVIYSQIQNKVLDEAIMIFMADPITIVGAGKNVKGAVLDWGGNYPLFHGASLN